MIASLPVLALAAISAVQAGPLAPRQASSVVSSVVSSAVANVTSSASSAVSSVTSRAANATSSVANATSAASSAVSSASSAVVSPSAGPNTTTGNESYPLYPCPSGYLLTYVTQNVSIPVPVQQVVTAFGNWSTSPVFPNVTGASGGNSVGARHVISVGGVNLSEELVNVTFGGASGSATFTWNLTDGPVTAMGVSVSNYSTVLAIYDPRYLSTNRTSNTTTVLSYTNFCANSQAAGMSLVGALTALELGTFEQVVAGGASGGGSGSSSSAASSTTSRASSSSSRAASTSSAARNVTSSANATSVVASATSSVGSAISSAIANVTSSVSA